MINDLKENIIEVVGEHEKINSIRIHNSLKKKSYNKSYQNTYKMLNKMLKEQILKKENQEYLINKDWLNEQIKKLNLYKDCFSKKNKNIYSDENLKIYNFNSLLELDNFWINLIFEEIEKNSKISEVFWEGPNCWWLFSNILGEEKYLNKLTENNIKGYFLIKVNNKLNLKAKKFYLDRNFNSEIISSKENPYLHRGIVGDKIIEITYQDEINKLFDDIYNSDNQDVFLEKNNQIMNLKTNLTIKIIKNYELSKFYEIKIKQQFKT